MNGLTLLAFVAFVLIALPIIARFGNRVRINPKNAYRCFFILEDLGEKRNSLSRYSLAWNQGFRTAKEARLMAKVLRDENRYMEGATLKIGYWDGQEWSGCYETV